MGGEFREQKKFMQMLRERRDHAAEGLENKVCLEQGHMEGDEPGRGWSPAGKIMKDLWVT